ncbi:hypothetical protein [Paraburkholderia agricolaris]|uniref:hypothetical protein n=1 Tax=Paraburkholderia agricolaris TaxID=2152888 RepID=UPI0012919111|nr:hypothetical protein [Paraburkholderia agricolaris]
MAVSAVVCGPASEAGVTYVSASGRAVSCGTDSAGNALVLQVSTLSNDQPVSGGEVAGLQIGGAVLSAMAVAWSIRAIRRHLDFSGEV